MNSDDESGAATPFVGDKITPFSLNYQNNIDRNEDTLSSSDYRLYCPITALEGDDIIGKRCIARTDAQSLQSVDTHSPPPTSPEDNSRLTSQYLSLVMSIIYAVLLVTFGIIIYSGDSFVGSKTSLIYSICLCGIGFAYILFLMIDISRYKCIALKNQRIKESYEEEYGLTSPEIQGDGSPEVFRPAVPPPAFIPLKHQYCFSEGRHAESFYLKLGASGFAIGHLVHSMLQITVQLGFLLDEDVNNDGCINHLATVLDFMIPCYCILQLYFIFKYSNVIILRSQCLAHFAMMHMIGSSLCFWIFAIVRETTLTLAIYAHSVYGNGNNGSQKYSDEQIAKKLGKLIDIHDLYNKSCTGSAAINTIIGNLSPYLFPFSVEFNILIVAVYYIIWSNIGNCDNYNKTSSETNSALPCKLPNANEDDDLNSNIVVHADCSASLRGLFAGMMLMVLVIGNLILGFVLGNVGGKFQKAGYLLTDVVKLGLHSLMLIAAVVAFTRLRRLDINQHPMSLLDDVLLFICLPAFFMETVLSMIATVNILNVIKSIDVIVMVVQVVIQTPLIMDGLRRCSNSKKLRRSKPGRELLMFLLIANVSMWLFNTFSYKSPESLDERYEFYGKVLWTVLGHISLPLIMFYRFHSSVCFADIWDSAYKPGEDH